MTKKNKIAAQLTGFLIGAVGGFFAITFLPSLGLQNILAGLTLLVLGFIFHIFIHEFGHLIAGKMSGYGFVSIRFFNFTIVNKDGKLIRKKFKVVGTLGQCLMSPPKQINGNYPFILYNLGGGLMNFIFSAVFVACYFIFSSFSGAWAFNLLAAIGVFIGLLNIVPLNLGIPNDGHNALNLGKNEVTRCAFWSSLNVNALMSQGFRHRDIPIEQYFFDNNIDLYDKNSNTLLINVAAQHFERLIDKHEFAEAKAFGENLLSKAEKMIEIHKNELRCELLFLELIGECNKEEIERLYTENLKKYIKATSIYTSRQRLLYAYAKLFLNDATEVANLLAKFNKTCLSHPFDGEIIRDRELIALVDDLANKSSTHGTRSTGDSEIEITSFVSSDFS